VHDLVAVAEVLEEVDPRLAELLAPFVVERLRRRLRRSVRRREELPVLLARRDRERRDVLLEGELERVAEERADMVLTAQSNGLPAPAGGGGRNGPIIRNICPSPPSGVQQARASRPPGRVTRASSRAIAS
jgi:hypothetical protein